MSKQLPTYSSNKQTGNFAADIIKAALQKFAIINTHDESIDLGIDMRGQIIKDTKPTDLFFNIQSKGTRNIEQYANGDDFTLQIDIKTVNYWLQQNETTFIFLVDINSLNCYWINSIKYLENYVDKDIQLQQSITFRLPKENCLNLESTRLPSEFIEYINLYTIEHLKKTQVFLKEINEVIKNGEYKNLSQSINFLKEVLNEQDKLNERINDVIAALIENIKKHLRESERYFDQLLNNYYARKYVDNMYTDTGFTTTKKNYILLNAELNEVIEKIWNADYSEKRNFIDELDDKYLEVVDYRVNVLAFLLEMLRDDNPMGNYETLEKDFDDLYTEKKNLKK